VSAVSNPFLNFLASESNPVIRSLLLANKDGTWLQSIQFIEVTFVWNIADEMINICFLFLLAFVLFEDEGLWPTKTVVQFANRVRIAQCKPSIFRWQLSCEVVKLFEVSLDVNGSIEKYRKDGLCGAGIVDDLPCKEEILIIV